VWCFFFVRLILTWIGGNPVETPYVVIGQVFTFLYFFLIFIVLLLCFRIILVCKVHTLKVWRKYLI
jgi:hypothetical protein